MRLGKTYLLLSAIFLLVLHLFQVPSYSLIRSRIQGTFRDKETGLPIENVSVTLYNNSEVDGFFQNYKTKTDKNGRFIFDQITDGEYIIRGIKSGYVTYQPEYKIDRTYGERKLVEVLLIKEGEIRHLDIKMEHGGQLLVKIYKKDENGISPYTDYSAQIGFKAGDTIDDIFTLYGMRNGGEYLVDGLEPSDRYTLSVSAIEYAGYPEFQTNFEIKKGEITTIEHTFDFTDNTGVTGVIFLDNEPVEIATLYLEDINSHLVAEASPQMEDRYTFRNIPPGIYTLKLYFIKENKKYRITKKILIEKDILINFDVKVNR
jgi:5-hydroxyisourate hydrolase-like protein (transthyretin family)